MGHLHKQVEFLTLHKCPVCASARSLGGKHLVKGRDDTYMLNKPVAHRNKKEQIFLRSLILNLGGRTPTDTGKDDHSGHAI